MLYNRDSNSGRRVKHSRSRSSGPKPTFRDYLSALVGGGVPVQGGTVSPNIAQYPTLSDADKRQLTGTPKLSRGTSAISFREAERNAEAGVTGGAGQPAAGGGIAAPQVDPIDQLVAKLFGMANDLGSVAVPGSGNIKAMLSQAGAAGAPYSAQINSIQHQNAGARQDTAKGRKQIQAMYRALAADDATAGQQAVATQQQLAQQINQQAATGNAANQARAQALSLDNTKYGSMIASELNNGISKQAQDSQAATTQQASNYAAAALTQGGNNNSYFQQNRSADRLEGTTKASDLVTQLQGYLQGNRDKISELAGQRSASVASARSAILSQISGQQQDAEKELYGRSQDRLGNLMKLLSFQSNRQNTNLDNARADASLQATLQNQLSSAQAKMQAAQDRSAQGNQLSPDELARILASNGNFKNMKMEDIIKQLAQIYHQ